MLFSKRKIEQFAMTGMITYHGTDLSKLPSIIKNGLQQSSDKKLYLTNNLETAARYSLGHNAEDHQSPCVLEIYISKQKRINKLKRDDLDREESIREDYGMPSFSGVEDFELALNHHFDKMFGKSHHYWSNIFEDTYRLDSTDPLSYNGANIYEFALNIGLKLGENANELKRKIRREMPDGTIMGDFTIEGGRIKLDKDIYDQIHQMTYPKALPSATIKFVWVSGINKDSSLEQIEVKPQQLAQENNRLALFFQNDITSDISQIERYIKKGDQEEAKEKLNEMLEKIKETLTLYRVNKKSLWSDGERIIKYINEGQFDEAYYYCSEIANDIDSQGFEMEGILFTKLTKEQALKYLSEQLNKLEKISSFKFSKRTASEGHFDWACLMADFPKDFCEKILKWSKENIKDDILYNPPKDRTYGRENHIHTTVAYGIDPKNKKKDIDEKIKLRPIKVKLGKIDKFEKKEDGYDVIKVNIISKDLHDLNNEIKEKIGTPGNEFPDFKPHMTIAYVKLGSCDDLLGNFELTGKEFELNTFDYSNQGEEHDKIIIKAILKTKIKFSQRNIADLGRLWLDENGKEYFIGMRTHSDWAADNIDKFFPKHREDPVFENLNKIPLFYFLYKGWSKIWDKIYMTNKNGLNILANYINMQLPDILKDEEIFTLALYDLPYTTSEKDFIGISPKEIEAL